jgi:hypothetical protein
MIRPPRQISRRDVPAAVELAQKVIAGNDNKPK